MSLIGHLSTFVPVGIRLRGEDLVRTNRVEVVDRSTTSFEANVNHSGDHNTVISWDDADEIIYSCECPAYYSGQVCRHVWAAILKAAEMGVLSGLESRSVRPILTSEEDADADSDFDDGYDPDHTRRDPLAALRSLRESSGSRVPGKPKASAPRGPVWRDAIKTVRGSMSQAAPEILPTWPAGREILYTIDGPRSLDGSGICVELATRERKKNGEWGKAQPVRMSVRDISAIRSEADRNLLAILNGGTRTDYYGMDHNDLPSLIRLQPSLTCDLLRQMCLTGRCRLRREDRDVDPPMLSWDERHWVFHMTVRSSDRDSSQYVVDGEIRSGDDVRPIADPLMLSSSFVFFSDDTVARFDDSGALQWLVALRHNGALPVPVRDQEAFLAELLSLPAIPGRLEVPEALRFERVVGEPSPMLMIKKASSLNVGDLAAHLSFDYGNGIVIKQADATPGRYDTLSRRLVERDREREADHAQTLRRLGLKQERYYGDPSRYVLSSKAMPKVIHSLLQEGWQVEADGALYRRPGEIDIQVTTGIDWFDLSAVVDFGGQKVDLPRLLEALRRGENMVRLDDGTFGMLPEQWLKKYGMLARAGKAQGEAMRFTRAQAGLLDALLASQPQARFDEQFQRLRDELRSFDGIRAQEPVESFAGALRPYQKESLGWFEFLRKFGLGGCLADDMGLGKTVQVLALLGARKAQNNGSSRPSLVVVPRSLVFNWKQEATKFVPNLRVLDHSTSTRTRSHETFAGHDLVITTYGTLRRDAHYFKDAHFDYVILDEAQAIKNSATESAKAARLLKGEHRLALSGTPIENHLGELWSLFDFLNPGLLGSASVFQQGLGNAGSDENHSKILSAALRPFILRRTKEQVARDLPECTEQTVFCELEGEQRKLYHELRDHYRSQLLGTVATMGMNKSRFVILEALLRLRQAACHPGLIDKTRTGESSAKLDALLEHLGNVVQEGHKALVFSQFTSLLSIVKAKLDEQGTTYEYLDGKTRDRQAKVDRFQSDPACKLFLISLKAGGLGLNLTGADYVFLLDPWWNPAVESQAIDRAHRIGQTRQVFAYRLIAKDTVEEKVLQLQATKRDLADAIIGEDKSLIGGLRPEDLQLLLS